ncbi:MAG: hypothetical protein WBP61_09705 [Nocardioides sp.]
MYDLSALTPFILGFFVLAAVGAALAVASLLRLAQEHRSPAGPVIAMSAAHPATAAATRRAA